MDIHLFLPHPLPCLTAVDSKLLRVGMVSCYVCVERTLILQEIGERYKGVGRWVKGIKALHPLQSRLVNDPRSIKGIFLEALQRSLTLITRS